MNKDITNLDKTCHICKEPCNEYYNWKIENSEEMDEKDEVEKDEVEKRTICLDCLNQALINLNYSKNIKWNFDVCQKNSKEEKQKLYKEYEKITGVSKDGWFCCPPGFVCNNCKEKKWESISGTGGSSFLFHKNKDGSERKCYKDYNYSNRYNKSDWDYIQSNIK